MNGDELGSQQLRFTPGPIRGSEYRFAIGSAGSCMLVLQTVLPALWFADGSSRVEVHGGTHNQAAPSADFICRVWEPLLARMGHQPAYHADKTRLLSGQAAARRRRSSNRQRLYAG